MTPTNSFFFHTLLASTIEKICPRHIWWTWKYMWIPTQLKSFYSMAVIMSNQHFVEINQRRTKCFRSETCQCLKRITCPFGFKWDTVYDHLSSNHFKTSKKHISSSCDPVRHINVWFNTHVRGLTQKCLVAWWRHPMKTISVLLAICVGNSPVTGKFQTQRPLTRSFDVSLICAWING